MFNSLSTLGLDAASLILRLGLGAIFMIHGYPKLKDAGKGAGQWLRGMGIPYGFGLFAGVVEFFGGIALLLGLLTPVVAALFAVWMIALIWFNAFKVKRKLVGGYELDVVLLISVLALAAIGGGVLSLDHLLLAF